MTTKQLLLFILFFITYSNFAQNKEKTNDYSIQSFSNNNVIQICDILPNLNSSNSICYTGNFSFSTSTTGNYSYTGNPQANYGCLSTQPNQTWFVLTVTNTTSLTKSLNFTFPNNNSYDIDAAIWGPIYQNDLINACASLYNSPITCDYDTQDPDLIITNAAVGQKYLLVITNYENTPNVLQITQPSGGTIEYCTPNCPTVPTPTILASASTINCGQSVTLNTTGCNAVTAWSDGIVGSSRTVSPTTNTTFTAICSNNGCISTNSNAININIQNLPAPVITSSASSISCGQSSTLTATGCAGTITWSNGAVGSTISVSPAIQTNYTATCKIGNCISPLSNTKTIDISNVAAPTISSTSNTVTCDQSVTLIANGCSGGSTIWSSGSTASSITVRPSVTTDYYVSCIVGGCGSIQTTKTITVNTISAPSVSASPTSINCGQSTTLTASGACLGTIKWSNGSSGTSVVVIPTQTTSYKAVCLNGSCSSLQSSEVTVTITGLATPVISANPVEVSCGQSFTLTATGCSNGTVKWSDGSIGSARTITPYQTVNLNATCTNNGCTSNSSNTLSVTISNLSPPTISATQTSIACGQSSVLTATGCSGTINWSNGNTGTSISVTPLTNITYTAICNNNSCISNPSNTVTITISALTPPTISGSPTTITCGQSSILTATGCTGTIKWSNGSMGLSISVIQSITTNYTATCSFNGGCVSASPNTVTITIDTSPDNDNTYQTATVITNSAYTSGILSLCPIGDQDWFKIFVYNKFYFVKVRGYGNTATGIYIFTYTNNNGVINLETLPSANSSTDTYLELYNSDGTTLLRTDDDSGAGVYSKISHCFTTLNLNHFADDYLTNTIVQKTSSETGGKITANNWIRGTTTNITYESKVIELNPGFLADTGSVFLARVGGCSNTFTASPFVDENKPKSKTN